MTRRTKFPARLHVIAVLLLLIPALLFAALCTGLVRVEHVKEASGFLISVMPVLFVSPAVGIVENWSLISSQLLPIFLLLAASTFLVFGISGRLTQLLMQKGGRSHD